METNTKSKKITRTAIGDVERLRRLAGVAKNSEERESARCKSKQQPSLIFAHSCTRVQPCCVNDSAIATPQRGAVLDPAPRAL